MKRFFKIKNQKSKIINYLHTLFLSFLFFGCIKTVSLSGLPAINVPDAFENLVEVKTWLAIGPFEFDTCKISPEESFLIEDLKQYGINEGSINDKSLKKMQNQGANVFLINDKSIQLKLFNYISGNKETKSNFYLISKINSAKTQDVTLIIDGSNNYTVWLNQNKLLAVSGKHNTNKVGDRFVNVTLNEGDNQLFIKINRESNIYSWDLICAIAPRQEAEKIFRVNYTGDFVLNPLIYDSLEIYSGPYTSGKIELFDCNGNSVASGFFDNKDTNLKPFVITGLNSLEDGFYETILTSGGESLKEMIYKGNYRKFVEQANNKITNINKANLYNDDVKAALTKVNHVNNLEVQNTASGIRYIGRNRVFWGYSLYRVLNGNPTTQFMSYNDKDGNSGVFIFHKSNRLQKNTPLVIIVPYALDSESMIEDWYTGNLDQIEIDNTLADHYGFAVAWIFAGGKHYSAINTEKEIAGIINKLHSEYDIDTQKVFIMGSCEAGRRALVQIALSPAGRYAACVVTSPITLSGGADGIPINLLPQMRKTPLLVKHGRNDTDMPVEHSRKFFAEAKKLKIPIEYIENDDSHIYIHRDFNRFAFDFFSKIDNR